MCARNKPIEKIVYDTCYDAVVTMTAFKYGGGVEDLKFSTGFIVDIVQNRLIVITDAHNILIDREYMSRANAPIITATVTNAYRMGSKIKNEIPIVVSLKILGVNISADLAVLYSVLPTEEIKAELFGYAFSEKTQKLRWSNRPVLYGETVYCLGNQYGSNLCMLTGNCADNNLIYLPESTQYTNNIQQIVTTLSATTGSSGAPMLYYDNVLKSGVVCGIVQWTKIDNDYTGGLNVFSLFSSYMKIYNLNISNRSINLHRLNYEGLTGKGFSGISTYIHVNNVVVHFLCKKYPKFNQSEYRNQSNGIMIGSFSSTPRVIPDSRVMDAINICECDYLKQNTTALPISSDRVKVGDIIMEINGEKLGDEGQDKRLSDIIYYNSGKTMFIKCLRPTTSSVQYYRFIVDQYPAELEYVSTDPTIDLIGWNFDDDNWASAIVNLFR